MDWLTLLQTAGVALVTVARLVWRASYYVTIPLHYPVYYAYALAVFLLSPLWFVVHASLGTASYCLDLAARLKFACATIIGICAGCVLHGTSSFIFVLLGIDTSNQNQQAAAGNQNQQRRRQGLVPVDEDEYDEQGQRRQLQQDPDFVEDDDDDYYGHEEEEPEVGSGALSNTNSTGWDRYSLSSAGSRLAKSMVTTSSSSSGRPSSRRDPHLSSSFRKKMDANELFENQWKLLRASEKPPRRRRRGLLSQTIHEESSESDLT